MYHQDSHVNAFVRFIVKHPMTCNSEAFEYLRMLAQDECWD